MSFFLKKLHQQSLFIRQAIWTLLLGLGLFFVARVVFYCSNYPIYKTANFADLATIFTHSIRFDLSALVYINALVLLSFILPFPFRHRPWYQYLQLSIFVFCNGTALLLEYIDIGFYKYAFRRSIMSDLQMMGNNQGNFGQYIMEYWHLVVVLLATWFALVYFFKKILALSHIQKRPQGFVQQSLLGILALAGLVLAARGGLQKRPLSPSSAAKYIQDNAQMHLMSNTSLNFISFIFGTEN